MKLLIIAMSCNLPFFIKEEELVKETWAKDLLDKKYDEIDFYFLKTSKDEKIEGNYIYVNTGDSFYDTFNKNIRCFELLNEKNIEYDFLLRTNLSTYINVPAVLNLLKNYTIKNQKANEVYGGEYIKSTLMTGAFRGNFVIFNRLHIQTLIKNKNVFYDLVKEGKINTDDNLYGYILQNNYTSFVPIKFNTFFQYTWKYDDSMVASNIDNLSTELVYVSYRYLPQTNGSDQVNYEYQIRENIEFPLCRKIHEFFINHPYNINDATKHLAGYIF